MKIRILDNSLRLRLSQSEVDQLDKEGLVRCTIRFSPSSALHYTIQKDSTPNISATFQADEIKVTVPSELIHAWANSDQVSISADTPINGTSSLKILIEKDFKCLTDRPGEDESDLFPNPDEQHLNC